MTKNKTHYQYGTQTKIAIIFSAPGKKEEDAKKPAAGQTGINLENLLEILANKNEIFSDIKKDNLRITNAWDKVEYMEKTERTEADFNEILQKDNLDRLAKEIKDIKKIIFCSGERAEIAILALKYAEKIDKNIKIIKIMHLGLQGLNQIKCDENGKVIKAGETGNTEKRLKVVANDILEQLGENKK